MMVKGSPNPMSFLPIGGHCRMGFKTYPKLRRPGHSSVEGLFASDNHRLVITEKFDGNNFRFTRDGDEIRYGSRNVDLGTDLDEIGGMFDDVSAFIDNCLEADDLRELESELEYKDSVDASVTLFGENAVQHTIDEYDWEQVPQFQLFDVFVERDNGTDLWLRWDDLEWVADYLDLETVPVVERTTVGEFREETDLEEFEVPESVYRTDDGPAEGVVFRNTATGVKAKFISEEFAERMEDAKSKDLVDPDDNNYLLLEKHVTERRIEKNIQKLLEAPDSDYDDLEMEMMEDLHREVWIDVWAEDFEEIIFEDWTLDLDRAHNMAARKCASHLRELIQNNERPVATVDPGTGRIVGEEVDDA